MRGKCLLSFPRKRLKEILKVDPKTNINANNNVTLCRQVYEFFTTSLVKGMAKLGHLIKVGSSHRKLPPSSLNTNQGKKNNEGEDLNWWRPGYCLLP